MSVKQSSIKYHIYIYIYTHGHKLIYIKICTQTYIYIYVHTNIHTYTHIYTYIYAHIYIYICIYVVHSISFQTFLDRHLNLSKTLENSPCYCYTSYEMTDQVLGFQVQMNSYSNNWNTPY